MQAELHSNVIPVAEDNVDQNKNYLIFFLRISRYPKTNMVSRVFRLKYQR